MNNILSKEQVLEKFGRGEHRTVFASGSFDLLHIGHVHFLQQSKYLNEPDQTETQPATLLVAVLSDENIRERKGSMRPVYPLQERLIMLSAIKYVDYIIPWEDHWSELRQFIKDLRPQFLAVNNRDPGIDNKKEIIEQVEGKLLPVSTYSDHSTTNLINKLGNNS